MGIGFPEGVGNKGAGVPLMLFAADFSNELRKMSIIVSSDPVNLKADAAKGSADREKW